MDSYGVGYALGGFVSIMWLYALLSWFACGAFASHVASEKSRCGICWFIWGILFGPMALLAAVGLPDNTGKSYPSSGHDGSNHGFKGARRENTFAEKMRHPGTWVALALLATILYVSFR